MLLGIIGIEFLLAVLVGYLVLQVSRLGNNYDLHLRFLHDLEDWDVAEDDESEVITDTDADTPIPPAYRAEDDDPDREDPDLKKLRESQRGFFS